MRGFRALSGELGFGLVLLCSLHASAQGAASAGFPAEPADAKEANSPVADAPTPPAGGSTPPEVPPPPPPVTEPAATWEPSAPADAPFEPTPPSPRSAAVPVIGFSTGFAIPMGKLLDSPDNNMSNTVSGQVPILGEFGWRAIPALFIGAYLGVAIGGVAGAVQGACDDSGTSCRALSGRLGLELQYHFLPEDETDPWLGYGIGFDFLDISQESSGHTRTFTFSGFEFAHFMGGVDFRLGSEFALGPVVDVALGRYTHVTEEVDGSSVSDESIPNVAGHQWLTLGVRVVFSP